MSATSDSFYVTLSSDASREIYTENNPSNFRVQLSQPLNLDNGLWKVGLSTIQFPCAINNVGPKSDTNMVLWNGHRRYEVQFPNWKCDTIKQFVEYLNELVENSAVTRTFKSNWRYMVEEVEKNRVSKLNPDNLSILNEFEKPLMKDFDTPELQDVYDIMGLKIDAVPSKITTPRAAPTSIYKTTKARMGQLRIKTLIDFNSGKEPDVYSIKFSYDKLGRFQVLCNSPDFDIGMSESLLVMTGIVDKPEFSMERYNRRRRFHSYLLYASNDVYLLRGLPRTKLRTFFTHPPSQKNMDYLTFGLHLSPDQVWADCTEDLTVERVTSWPYGSKWEKYFDCQEFYELVQQIETLHSQTQPLYKQIGHRSKGQTFHSAADTRFKGSVVAYFMMKTLVEEQLMGRTLYADIPPHMNYPNDTFLIYSDIVKPELFNNLHAPLLGMLIVDGAHGEIQRHEVSNIHYKYLTSNQISSIKIMITSILGRPIPFQRGPVFIQLHLIRARQL
jgi:hypothetical protein